MISLNITVYLKNTWYESTGFFFTYSRPAKITKHVINNKKNDFDDKYAATENKSNLQFTLENIYCLKINSFHINCLKEWVSVKS